MAITFECSDCGKSLKVKDDYAGRKIRCPNCESAVRVPDGDSDADDDDDSSSRSRSSRSSKSASSRSGSSRPEPSRRSPSRRGRSSDEDDEDETPRSSKKKKGSKKLKSDSDGGVPVWAIVTGSGVVGALAIGVIAFIAMKPGSARAEKKQVAAAAGDKAKPVPKAAQANDPNVVQAQADGNGAKFRMKWEMPQKWTHEGGIEDNLWPWARMKGQGQTIRLASNRSFNENASTMTAMGGFTEKMKTAHTVRVAKLQAENNDWVEGPLNIHKGKRGPVIWSDYEYKGMIGKGYGIRCTIVGPGMPCTLMMETGQSARDKWRPVLLKIAESVHFVSIKKNGEEGIDGFDDGLDGDRPVGGRGENADMAEDDTEMDDDPDEK